VADAIVTVRFNGQPIEVVRPSGVSGPADENTEAWYVLVHQILGAATTTDANVVDRIDAVSEAFVAGSSPQEVAGMVAEAVAANEPEAVPSVDDQTGEVDGEVDDPASEVDDPAGLSTAVADYASAFGYFGTFLTHPQVGPILMLASHHGWDQERLEAELKQSDVDYARTLERVAELTDLGYDIGITADTIANLQGLDLEGIGAESDVDRSWWQTTEQAERDWQLKEADDSSTAAAELSDRVGFIRNEAGQLRIRVNETRLSEMARDSIIQAWTNEQLREALLAEAQWDEGAASVGIIGGHMRSIRGMVDDYMVTYSPARIEGWARSIYLGQESLENLEADFAATAKSMFPTLSDKIDRGYTVRDIFDPYAEHIASMLEYPSGASIDFLNDPRFTPIIDYATADGDRRAMTLSETSEYVRSLPDWLQTTKAKTSAQRFADFIGRKFGKAA